MKNKHTLTGLAFLLVFLATGAYMRLSFPAAHQNDFGMRLMFRSAHVYILLGALLNLLAGTALDPTPGGWRRFARGLGSALLLPVPGLFTIAFFVEPAPQSVTRPVVLVTCFVALVGTLAYAAASWRSQ